MNREDARKKFISPALCKAHTTNMLDKIYDDFESRICKNCTHHTGVTADQGWWGDYTCKELKINTSKNFGCNKFERKTNEN
jgi:hypothetical protein